MISSCVAVGLTVYRSLLSDDDEKPEKVSALRRAYEKTYWVWIVTIILDLIAQGFRSAEMHDSVKRNISRFALWSQYSSA